VLGKITQAFGCLLITSSLGSAAGLAISFNDLTANLTNVNSTYSVAISGTGSANITSIGETTITLNGTGTRERGLNCGDYLQLNLVFTLDATDTLTAVFTMPLTGFGSPQPFTITGGTGLLAGSSGTGTVTVNANATNTVVTGSGSGTLSLGAPLPTPPTISPSGIVPVYSTVPIVQPGSWISIYGANFVSTSTTWTGNFPTNLGGVTVTIDSKPAYLWFVSPGQINLQVPNDATQGCVNVVVNTPTGSVSSQVTLQAQQPSLDLLDGSKYAVAEIPSTTNSGAYAGGAYDLMGPAGLFPFNTRPVKVGETIELYGVGFGPTLVPVTAGQVLANYTQDTITPTVTIGGVNAQVTFAGEVEAGLYQLNVVIPQVPSGDEQIIATVPGANPVLFSADMTQNCTDPDPEGSMPTNCAVYLSVQ
jgi:uncharacterized protein (TIGR03437 family)